MLALALALSLAGLAVGPLLAAIGRGRALTLAALEGLTLGLLPALLLVRHLPHVTEEIGVAAVAAMAAGYAGLTLLERRRHAAGERVGRGLVVTALAIHAFTDGAGLALAAAAAEGGRAEGALLGAALLVHRMPEGLFLVTAVLPELGWARTLARLGVVALATVLGAVVGDGALDRVPHELFEGFIAVGLGAMLAMALHGHGLAPGSRASRRVSGVAFLVGAVAAVAVPTPAALLTEAHPRELSVLESLGPLFVETAPSMLLGLVVAGLLHAYLPRHLIAWLRGGGSVSQALRGMIFGLPLPLCSCGVLPLSRRLLAAGVPTAAVVAFAIGAPELDAGSAILSVRLLGAPLAALRVAASAALAMAVALLVARVAARPEVSASAEAQPAPPSLTASVGPDPAALPRAARLRAALGEAFGPTLDHVAAWYIVGLLIAAVFEATVDPGLAAGLPAPLDLLVSAVVAIPVYVCAQGATPLAAVMVHKGFSVGAALTFLLVGPATNIAILAVLRRSLGLRAALAFGLGSVACGVAMGVAANALVSPATVPEVHALVAHDHAHVEWLAAVALGALILASLLRLGPRAWFATLSMQDHAPGEPHDHDHDHDHDHHHDHGHGHVHDQGHVHGRNHAHAHDEQRAARGSDVASA